VEELKQKLGFISPNAHGDALYFPDVLFLGYRCCLY